MQSAMSGHHDPKTAFTCTCDSLPACVVNFLRKAHRDGLVTSESTTVPGLGLRRFAAFTKKRVFILFVTITIAILGLKIGMKQQSVLLLERSGVEGVWVPARQNWGGGGNPGLRWGWRVPYNEEEEEEDDDDDDDDTRMTTSGRQAFSLERATKNTRKHRRVKRPQDAQRQHMKQ